MSKYGVNNAEQKVARVPVKFAPTERSERLKKPEWIRAKFPGTPEVMRLKKILREIGMLASWLENDPSPPWIRNY